MGIKKKANRYCRITGIQEQRGARRRLRAEGVRFKISPVLYIHCHGGIPAFAFEG